MSSRLSDNADGGVSGVDESPLVIRSGGFGLFSAMASAAVSVAIGVAIVALNGLAVAALVFGGLFLGLAIIVVADYPLWVRFDSAGVTRRTLLRKEHMPWSTVVMVTRVFGRPRGLPSATPRPGVPGGLVAVVGGRKRRWLCNQVERDDQRAALVKLADRVGVDLSGVESGSSNGR